MKGQQQHSENKSVFCSSQLHPLGEAHAVLTKCTKLTLLSFAAAMVSTSVLCGILNVCNPLHMEIAYIKKKKKKTLPTHILLSVCVHGETYSPAERHRAKHTKDRFRETGSATNRQRDK